ncbi:MAG: hypothetical protein ACJAT2_000176 [Bacteriovoracaceae bacterium]|jgi:hypothetical protein
MKVFLLLIISFPGWSKVIDHSVTLKRIEIYTMKEACQLLGHTDLLLVDKKDRSTLDCMGKYEKVTSFCEKKFPKDPTLTRGYIDHTSNQVICERGKNVVLKVACDKRDLPYCKNPKKGCEKLGKIFATRLEVFRSTLVKFSKGRALNCFYSVKEDESETLQNLKLEINK